MILEEASVHVGVARGETARGHEVGDVGRRLVRGSGDSHVCHGERCGAGARHAERGSSVVDITPALVPVVELRRRPGGHGVAVEFGGLVRVGVGGDEVDGCGLVEGELEHGRVGVLVGVRGYPGELLVTVEGGGELLGEVGGDACGDAGVVLVDLLGLLLGGTAVHAARDAEDDHDENRDCGDDEQHALEVAAKEPVHRGAATKADVVRAQGGVSVTTPAAVRGPEARAAVRAAATLRVRARATPRGPAGVMRRIEALTSTAVEIGHLSSLVDWVAWHRLPIRVSSHNRTGSGEYEHQCRGGCQVVGGMGQKECGPVARSAFHPVRGLLET